MTFPLTARAGAVSVEASVYTQLKDCLRRLGKAPRSSTGRMKWMEDRRKCVVTVLNARHGARQEYVIDRQYQKLTRCVVALVRVAGRKRLASVGGAQEAKRGTLGCARVLRVRNRRVAFCILENAIANQGSVTKATLRGYGCTRPPKTIDQLVIAIYKARGGSGLLRPRKRTCFRIRKGTKFVRVCRDI